MSNFHRLEVVDRASETKLQAGEIEIDYLAGRRLTLSPPNYSIWIFTHLKLCLADAIHNFKWVKIIPIWQNGGQLFLNLAGWWHIFIFNIFKKWYLMC